MTIPFKIGNKSVEVPTGWNDLTVKQWNDLRNSDTKDITVCLGILLNIDKEMIENSSVIDIDVKLAPALKWIYKAPDLSKLPLKKTIRIGKKDYDVPTKLAIKTLAQKVLFQDKLIEFMDTTGNIKIEAIADMVAIYMFPYQPYSPDKPGSGFDDIAALEWSKEVEQCKMFDVYPVAAFFLRTFLKYLSKTNNS